MTDKEQAVIDAAKHYVEIKRMRNLAYVETMRYDYNDADDESLEYRLESTKVRAEYNLLLRELNTAEMHLCDAVHELEGDSNDQRNP